MIPEHHFTDEEVKERLVQFYGEKKDPVGEAKLPMIRQKLASLSAFAREIKVNFTRFYNKRNGRRGYFTNSGIIGSRAFILTAHRQFKHLVQSGYKRKPETLKGLEGMFSLKRMSETI